MFAANFTPNGLSGDYGGTVMWTRVAGTAVARRLYLLNEKFTAQQVIALGTLHEVVPAADLRDRGTEIAASLARVSAITEFPSWEGLTIT